MRGTHKTKTTNSYLRETHKLYPKPLSFPRNLFLQSKKSYTLTLLPLFFFFKDKNLTANAYTAYESKPSHLDNVRDEDLIEGCFIKLHPPIHTACPVKFRHLEIYTHPNACLLWSIHSKPLVSQDRQVWVRRILFERPRSTFGHRDSAVM